MTVSTPLSKAWAAVLIVWAALALTGAALVEHGETRVLLPPLAGLVGALGLWRPRPHTGALAGLVAAGAFAIARYLADGATGLEASSVVALIGLIGAGLLADVAARQMEADALQRYRDALLIEELTPIHGESGAMKWEHAAGHLADELGRAKRYRYPVSLALLTLGDRQVGDVAPDGSRNGDRPPVLHDVARLALRQIRAADRISAYGEAELAVILPHTPLDGALAWLNKLYGTVAGELGVQLQAGVVEFPADAATAGDLMREAEAALELARASNLAVASRRLLEESASPASEVTAAAAPNSVQITAPSGAIA